MPSLKRLESKLEDLEEEEEEIRKKLKWLKKERTIKTDSEAKYELDQRIEECQAELQEKEAAIEQLEEKMSQLNSAGGSSIEKCQVFDLLHKSLLKLGYWEQHNFFETIFRQNSYGAFLIQGRSKDYGQRWLLNRLALIIPHSLEGKNITIDLNRTSARTDIVAIWDEFAGRVGLPEGSSPAQIAESICDLWKTQNVIIAFNNVDETIKENLCDLIQAFWASLAHILLEHQGEKSLFKLFIFFLDYQCVVSQWDVGFVSNNPAVEPPHAPLQLPEINPFSNRDLGDWLNYQSDFLPSAIVDDKTETIAMLLEKQGMPMPTLRKICDICGCNWFEQEGKWLRL
jgi:inactive STAND